jgi:hexosaminidase
VHDRQRGEPRAAIRANFIITLSGLKPVVLVWFSYIFNVMMVKFWLTTAALLAVPSVVQAQDLVPPLLESTASFQEEIWSVESSSKIIYIEDEFASISDTDGLTLIPPTAHDFATTFRDDLEKVTGFNWTLKQVDKLPTNATDISLGAYTGEASDLTYENGKSTSEGYELQINSRRVFIGGNGARGMWWGTRTLLQLLLTGNGTATGTIGRDAPSYATRGYMLDAGRKWYSKDFLKEMCSYASFFKINEFHYHLSDNYPLNRGKNETWQDVYSHFSLLPEDKDLRGILHGRENETLSKDEFAELQKHCASRGVTVIPEIEAPGHSLYLTKWKPELALAKKDLLNLTHPDTLPTVQRIWTEFLPWFETREVHIGADEYDAELADDYITFVNKMSRFINSTSDKRSRIWGTHEPSKKNQTIDKNIVIQHWQYGQSDPVQLVKDGYDVINSEDWWAYTSLKNDHMPILPARYPQFFNESRVFNFANKDEWQWTPADFNPVNTSLQLKDDEARLRGATLAAWNDNGPDASTQLEAYYSMRRGIALVGARAWSGSRGPQLLKETTDTSVDFYSPRAPDQDLDRILSSAKDKGALLSWTRTRSDGKQVQLGHGSKGMNYTLTLSVNGPFTLSGPDNSLALDKEGNLVFTADGWEYPLRQVSSEDALELDPGHPGRIWANASSSTHEPVIISTPNNITLVTDVLHGTIVLIDGDVVGRFEVFVYGGRNTLFSWSQMAFVAPLEKLEGDVDHLSLQASVHFSKADKDEPSEVPKGNEAVGCTASPILVAIGLGACMLAVCV